LVAEWTPTVCRVLFMAKAFGAEDNEIFAVRTYTVEAPDFDLPPLPVGYLAWSMPEAITPDIAIYPVAETEDCIITFVNEQGEVVASLLAVRGEALRGTLPAVPAKKGYRGSWMLPETVEGDLTVRPQYEVITYKAYFYDENGDLVKLIDEDGKEYEYSEYTVLDGKLITPAVPEKAHFYGAWNLPAEMVGDLEITVLYTPILYKISYQVFGVPTFERYYTIDYVLDGLEIADPAVPEQIGLVPTGWTEYDLTLLTDQTVTAQYTSSQYTVQFYPGHDEPMMDSKLLSYDDTFRLDEAFERRGYVLLGWRGSDGVLYEAGAELSRLTSEHLAIFTFTAEWREIVYRIEFSANGGSTTPATMENITYEQMITLPEAITRTGYIFQGWILPDGSVLNPGLHDGWLTDIDGATVILTAKWTPITYTVQFDSNGGGSVSSFTVTYDQPFTLPTNPGRDGYTFNYWTWNGRTWTGGAQVSENLTTVNGDTITFVASWTVIPEPDPEPDNGPCVATGTLVTLADGTTKRVEELKGDEILLVWDFVTGSYVERPIVFLYCHGDSNYILINLEFSDGTTIEVIGEHGFYDPDLKQFVLITSENCQDYIGHRFAKMNGVDSENGAYSYVTLVNAFVEVEYTGSYSVWTAQNVNFITNGMLSLTPLEFSFFEKCFEYGENMMFDQEQMQADLEKYGVYTYEEWSAYMTYEQFLAFNGPYIKVAVGKGLTTEEELLMLISEYLPKEGESNIRG